MNPAAATPGVIDMSDSSVRAPFVAAFFTRTQDGPEGAMRAFAFAFGVGAAGRMSAGAGDCYDEAHWRPREYWAARDSIWMGGTVEVRPLQRAGHYPQCEAPDLVLSALTPDS